MKRIILAGIALILVVKGYSQCPLCHDGKRDVSQNVIENSHTLPPDSSGGLAKLFILQNVFGLNWEQSSLVIMQND